MSSNQVVTLSSCDKRTVEFTASGAQEANEVLRELFLLLEEFAPSWYTEAHHERALAAMERYQNETTTLFLMP